jgi:hypothetical protein
VAEYISTKIVWDADHAAQDPAAPKGAAGDVNPVDAIN